MSWAILAAWAALSGSVWAADPEPAANPEASPAPTASTLPVAMPADLGTDAPANVPPPAQGGFVIESISGADSVTVAAPGESAAEVRAGTRVTAGSRVRLKPQVTATLLYTGGARVVLSQEADFEAAEPTGGAYASELHAGRARGTVPTPKAALTPGQSSGADPKRKIRFLIRTRSAVMGVRGTVFEILSEAGESARFETIEGTVEVAKDQAALLSGNGVEVPAGQFVTATPQGISAPQAVSGAPASVGSTAGLPGDAAAAPATSSPSASEWLPKLHLFAFEGGALFSEDPRVPSAINEGSTKVSPFIAWRPGIGLPKLDFIRIRAHLEFAKRESFTIRETGIFLTGHVLGFAFAEIGWGDQTWLGQAVSGGTFATNAGLLLGNGKAFFDRIYVGHVRFKASQQTISQWRLGLGISF